MLNIFITKFDIYYIFYLNFHILNNKIYIMFLNIPKSMQYDIFYVFKIVWFYQTDFSKKEQTKNLEKL